MGERSPEVGPVSNEVREEVTEGAPELSLKEQVLAMFPERCRNGDGSSASMGDVCSRISVAVDMLLKDHADGFHTTEQVLSIADKMGWTVDATCISGPSYKGATSTLQCSSFRRNFYISDKPN